MADVTSTSDVVNGTSLPAVVESDAYALTPAALGERLKTEGEKRKLLMDYVRAHLVAGTDYGMIHRYVGQGQNKHKCSYYGKHLLDAKGNPAGCPECGAKHSLWKPGAEKIGGLLHVTATYSVDTETMTALAMTGKGVAYSCHLVSLQTGAILAEGRGAATLDGDYNKAIKMAKKSAMIDSTLGLAGLSSLFTQDVEDLKGIALENYTGSAESAAANGGGVGTQSVENDRPSPRTGPEQAHTAEPVCPKCGAVMAERSGKRGKFWGCINYPDCKGTRLHRWKPEAKSGAAKAEGLTGATGLISCPSQATASDATSGAASAEGTPSDGNVPERQNAAPDLSISINQKAAIKDLCGKLDWKMGPVMELAKSLGLPTDIKKLTVEQADKLIMALLETLAKRSVEPKPSRDTLLSAAQMQCVAGLRQSLGSKLGMVEWMKMLAQYECERTGDLTVEQADELIAALNVMAGEK